MDIHFSLLMHVVEKIIEETVFELMILHGVWYFKYMFQEFNYDNFRESI